ncbi:dolichyl-phosphate-mannose--protein mannosyltransferase [Herbiconiux sp. L3-i23]|uniref:dolichyl-phosphate-mannose--protein mannosyltransferase n=1 Tax=Herbiconiux sp. L3-i23 TaxID=2905871 RepID=UPI002067F251|nr:phospholipid carrier-dependent glycosyltransferase [Herbiconiux sp. L3-i23]BDI23647.1 dolichyl-phosphate-mannose--protein mannosyltransferase [Herbiconiux sp. L3-i23]
MSAAPTLREKTAGRGRWAVVAASPWWRWGGPIGVTILAAVLRLQSLGHPATLMFDETFYVKDAWTILNLGYEGSWPDGADESFNSGDVDVFRTTASYPAHPPLGKWLIALGIAALGPTDPTGWRLSVAVAGILGVVLLMLIAQRMWRNTTLTVLAGGLFAIDGHAIALSRVGLLDNFVMLFGLLGFGAVLLDRLGADRRLDRWLDKGAGAAASRWGPALWNRPWLIAAGAAFGLMTAVKWSGLYFLAFFALYTVAADALQRRRAGIPLWAWGTLLKQAPVTFVLMVPIALVAYLASWSGWFLTSGGYDRNWIADGGERWTGALAWVPDVLQNLWHWHAGIYAFHNGLSASHPYATPAILWPLLARPTQIYYQGSANGENGCGFDYCSEIVWSIANPILWWAACAAALYLLYRFIRHREWLSGLVLTGIAAGYLPWLLYPTRTMFQFYAIAFEPSLLLCLVATLGIVLGILPAGPHSRPAASSVDGGDSPPSAWTSAMARMRAIVPASWSELAVRRRFVVVFLALVVAVSAFFYPLWTGMQTPFWFWTLHVWLPSWV